LGEYAVGISKKSDMMEYLKENDQGLAQKIQTLAKSHEHKKDLGLDIDF